MKVISLQQKISSESARYVQITTEGQWPLGVALGSVSFKESYVSEKVNQWVKEIENLTKIIRS